MMTTKTDRITHVKLRVSAYPEYLSLVRNAARAVTDKLGFGGEIAEGIVLAVQEAMTNVIRHGYGQACDEKIVVVFSELQGPKYPKGAIEISIRDYGSTVDPDEIYGRDLDDVRPGGLGVHIMKTIMDECSYFKMADRGMELKMIKAVVN